MGGGDTIQTADCLAFAHWKWKRSHTEARAWLCTVASLLTAPTVNTQTSAGVWAHGHWLSPALATTRQ